MFRKILIGLLVLIVLAVGVVYMIAPPVSIPLAVLTGGIEADEEALDRQIKVPEGFTYTLYATGLKNARMMVETAGGDLLVSTPRSGEVHLVSRDDNDDGAADGQRVLLSDLTRPHGLAILDGWLYVGESNAIGRIRIDDAGEVEGDYKRIVTGLPEGIGHWPKTLKIGSDGFIYGNIGSSCNVCIEDDERSATIMRFSLDGKVQEIYARGLRNTVGFDWSPRDGKLYGTDNGRDLLGNDFPPCELNQIEQDGFYGWPFVNGFGDLDPDFGKGNEGKVAETIQPVHGFQAHNAPLGMTFLRGGNWPEEFHQDALVALHGSWNRTDKDGYKVVWLDWAEDGSITERDFMTGFLADGDVIGRPVDVIEAGDGAVFISDDFNGSIYRVAYGEAEKQGVVAQREEEPMGPIEVYLEEQVDRGAQLFDRHECGVCHGPSDDDTVTLELFDLGEKYNLAELESLLKTPPPPMPIVPLSEEELEDLAVYLLATY